MELITNATVRRSMTDIFSNLFENYTEFGPSSKEDSSWPSHNFLGAVRHLSARGPE